MYIEGIYMNKRWIKVDINSRITNELPMSQLYLEISKALALSTPPPSIYYRHLIFNIMGDISVVQYVL